MNNTVRIDGPLLLECLYHFIEIIRKIVCFKSQFCLATLHDLYLAEFHSGVAEEEVESSRLQCLIISPVCRRFFQLQVVDVYSIRWKALGDPVGAISLCTIFILSFEENPL